MNNHLGPHSLRSNMLTYFLVRAFLQTVETTLGRHGHNLKVKYVIEYNEKPYRFHIEPNTRNRYSSPSETLTHHTL
jgi:hypothetical protein